MKKIHLRPYFSTILSHLYLISFVIPLLIPTITKAADIIIKHDSNKLTADITKAPLQNVLTLLAEKLDIPIYLDKTLKTKKVSVKFENMDIEEGIKKLVHPYSTAIIFGKKKDNEGKSIFFISKVNVYNSSNKDPSYLAVGDLKKEIQKRDEKMSASEKVHRAQQISQIPEERKDPSKAAALNKKISSSILKSKITHQTASIRKLQHKIADQSQKKMMQIQELENQLSSADGKEKNDIQSKLVLLRSELNSSRQKQTQELKKQQMELEQMKKRMKSYEQTEAAKKSAALTD